MSCDILYCRRIGKERNIDIYIYMYNQITLLTHEINMSTLPQLKKSHFDIWQN